MTLTAAWLLCSLALLTSLRGQESAPSEDQVEAPSAVEEDAPDRTELEKAFAENLSGATLVGSFTILGKEDDERPLKPERYHIRRVTKLQGDTWLFLSGVEYGGKKEVVVPMPLTVKWAGDTPVITLTDLTIPGLGTFTARVLIYRDQYAGTWQHGDVGGQMFGKIVREDEAAEGESETGE